MKMKRIVLFLLVVGLLFMIGCGAAKSEEYGMDYGMYEEAKTESVEEMPQALSTNPEPIQLKIIKNLSMRIQVEDVNQAEKKINEQIEALNGYVANYSRNDYEGEETTIRISAKVPAESLNDMQKYLEGIGFVDSADMYTEDITDQYYDIQSRLDHALAQEKKYLDILEDAETTEDVLMIMEELDGVQERIEQFKGKIKMWDGLVDFSEVDITIYPETSMINNDSEVGRFISGNEIIKGTINGVKSGARFIVNLFGYLIIALGYLLLPGIIIVIIVLLIKAYRKKHPKKEKVKKRKEKNQKLTAPVQEKETEKKE